MNAFAPPARADAPPRANDRSPVRLFELHGDRLFADDPAILGGIAELDGTPVTVIGIEKGEDTRGENHPELRLPQPGGLPQGAAPDEAGGKVPSPRALFLSIPRARIAGLGAEERGQGSAIAQNLVEMMGLKTPVISVLIGEGGSGGALALAAVWKTRSIP